MNIKGIYGFMGTLELLESGNCDEYLQHHQNMPI